MFTDNEYYVNKPGCWEKCFCEILMLVLITGNNYLTIR